MYFPDKKMLNVSVLQFSCLYMPPPMSVVSEDVLCEGLVACTVWSHTDEHRHGLRATGPGVTLSAAEDAIICCAAHARKADAEGHLRGAAAPGQAADRVDQRRGASRQA